MTFCYFSCLGRYYFRPTSMAALTAQAAADVRLSGGLEVNLKYFWVTYFHFQILLVRQCTIVQYALRRSWKKPQTSTSDLSLTLVYNQASSPSKLVLLSINLLEDKRSSLLPAIYHGDRVFLIAQTLRHHGQFTELVFSIYFSGFPQKVNCSILEWWHWGASSVPFPF